VFRGHGPVMTGSAPTAAAAGKTADDVFGQPRDDWPNNGQSRDTRLGGSPDDGPRCGERPPPASPRECDYASPIRLRQHALNAE
jgi:hypothetical protein